MCHSVPPSAAFPLSKWDTSSIHAYLRAELVESAALLRIAVQMTQASEEKRMLKGLGAPSAQDTLLNTLIHIYVPVCVSRSGFPPCSCTERLHGSSSELFHKRSMFSGRKRGKKMKAGETEVSELAFRLNFTSRCELQSSRTDCWRLYFHS